MRFDEIKRAIQRQAHFLSVPCEFQPPASVADIERAERRLGLTFPPAVREFYECCNGFTAGTNRIDILSVDRLERVADCSLLVFARVYGTYDICFDTSGVNRAGQWTVLYSREACEITLTIGSFLASRIRGYLESPTSDWLESLFALRARGPVDGVSVWVFNGSQSLASGVFSSREKAEQWIIENQLTGLLTRYCLDVSAYEYAVRYGHFTPKNANEVAPRFIARFTGGWEHYHYGDDS